MSDNGEVLQFQAKSKPMDVINTAQASGLLGIKPHTLRVWRMQGKGPRYFRLGSSRKSRAVYRRQEVIDWIESRHHQSTSEERWEE